MTVTNGRREVRLTCGPDGVVRWHEPDGRVGPIPAKWAAAVERYHPVLLYPEISPVIDDPTQLHEFLKGAIDLSTLEELLARVEEVQKEGREATKAVAHAYQEALASAQKLDGHDLRFRLSAVGATPDAIEAEALKAKAAAILREAEPVVLDLPEVWEIDDQLVESVKAGAVRLHQARSRVVAGAQTVQDTLDRLLQDNAEHLAELRRLDQCPVCGSRGASWVAAATAENQRLQTLLSDVREAERVLRQRLDRFRSCLPGPLSERARAVLADSGDPRTDEHIAAWQRLEAARSALKVETVSVGDIDSFHAQSRELLKWYVTVRESIAVARTAATSQSVEIQRRVKEWLAVLDRNRRVLERARAAERLMNVVRKWIKRARDEIFQPIEKEIIDMWAALTSDSDLVMTGVALSGGVQKARKVTLDLTLGGTPVPPGADASAVLSTGQRNALSLATYLPRATQQTSPFRFLVLDDPIHAFDDWRVRYLAQRLAALAHRFQIIVFTHDDRLWRALCGRGYRPTHARLDRVVGKPSRVRVIDVTCPSEHYFREIDEALDVEDNGPLGTPQARAAMTLALCRQAVDTEVTAQVEIIGRRLDLPEEKITSDLADAQTTRRQLKLLNEYARRAGLRTVDTKAYDNLITLLNGAAHGQADSSITVERCRRWVREARELASLVRAVTV